MKKLIQMFFVLFLLLTISQINFAQALTGDKIIKASGGDFATLEAAFTAVNTNGVSGTVRLLIDENLNEIGANLILNRTDLSAVDNVVIKPNVGITPVVTFTGCASTGNNAFSGITIDGVAAATGYVTFDGSNQIGGTSKDLTFELNDATAGKYCINAVGNADYITVKNCKFIFTAIMDQSVSANRGAGVRTNGTGASVTIDNVTIQNNEIGTPAQAAGYGILINNASSTYSSNVNIIDNIVFGSTVPINTLRANAVGSILNVTGNTVSLIGFDTPLGYSEYGIWIDQSSDVVNILNNKIIQVNGYNNAASTYPLYGIYCGRQNAGSIVNVVNNFITNFSWHGTFKASNISGIHLAGTTASTYNIYYNSLNLNGDDLDGNTGNIISLNVVSANSIVNFINNILVNSSNTATSFGISAPTTSVLTSNFNDLYVPGANANVGSYNALAQQTLTDWQTASGQDANSISKEVNFISVSDLHLTGASLGDIDLAGTPLIGYTTDIDGETRDLILPYKGADENLTFPIPVELVSFSANLNGNNVSLLWSTATETNSLGFEVQKRINDQNDWSNLGLVRSSGTSTVQHNYSYIDNNCGNGKLVYRLKMIDYDGSFEFSNEVFVQTGIPAAFNLEQNYPNPFNPSTKIVYQLPEKSSVKLTVYDVIGNEVAVLVNSTKEAGTHTIDFNAEKISAGVYCYMIKTDNWTVVKKMILLK